MIETLAGLGPETAFRKTVVENKVSKSVPQMTFDEANAKLRTMRAKHASASSGDPDFAPPVHHRRSYSRGEMLRPEQILDVGGDMTCSDFDSKEDPDFAAVTKFRRSRKILKNAQALNDKGGAALSLIIPSKGKPKMFKESRWFHKNPKVQGEERKAFLHKEQKTSRANHTIKSGLVGDYAY